MLGLCYIFEYFLYVLSFITHLCFVGWYKVEWYIENATPIQNKPVAKDYWTQWTRQILVCVSREEFFLFFSSQGEDAWLEWRRKMSQELDQFPNTES